MTKTIVGRSLTTCTIEDGGNGISLGLIDDAGNAVSVKLSTDHAEAITVTLPHLLTKALRMKRKNMRVRFVYELNEWTLEQSEDNGRLILTLATGEGFGTSFAFPRTVSDRLGRALRREARSKQVSANSKEVQAIRLN